MVAENRVAALALAGGLLSVRELLVTGLPVRGDPYGSNLICEMEGEGEAESEILLLSLLDGTVEPSKDVVVFGPEASMASSCWFLKEVRTPERGYLILDLCEGPEDFWDGLELLAAWEPSDNDYARHECVVDDYSRI